MDIDLGFEVLREILGTSDVFLRESQRLFRPHGLTASQYNVLSVLAAAEGGLSQRELSDALVVDRSNVTGLLDRMEKAGWVQRTAHPEDRRVHRVVLTKSGTRLWETVSPLYVKVVEQVFGGIPDKKLREALSVLQTLRQQAMIWETPKA